MPSNFSGDPNAAESPSPAPGPGVVPIVALPADADPPNAATFAQAYKILANFIAWLTAPFAIISAWTQATFTFRNARLLTRFGVDHFGFPNGNITQWEEQWDDPLLQAVTTTGNTIARRWAFHTDGSGVLGGVLTSHPPQWITGAKGHRLLGITTIPNGGRADIQLNASAWNGVFTDDMVFGMFCPFFLQVGATTNCTFLLGFTTNFQPSSAITDGAYMFKTPSNTNWQFTTVSGGVATAAVDTGVPTNSGAVHTLGLVLVGANQSDDSIARALLFIDGALVANVASNLPFTTGGAGAGLPLSPIMGVNTSAGASVTEFYVGPIRYRQNMFAGDAMI